MSDSWINLLSLFDVKGKVVLIMGVFGVFGVVVVKVFVGVGCKLVLVVGNEVVFVEVVVECEVLGVMVVFFVICLVDEVVCDKFVVLVVECFGVFDVLVVVFGMNKVVKIDVLIFGDFENVIDVNVI